MTRVRVNEIDLLRFLAALAVVFYHYAFRGNVGDRPCVAGYPLLEPVAKYGYLGVHLFFMISGFVILMTAAEGSLRAFIVSRVVRLYPAFWAACTLTFLVSLSFSDPRFTVTAWQYAVNMTMLGEFLGMQSIDDAYWSLFIEMQFYFLIALVIALRQIRKAPVLLWVWLVASIALEVVRVSTLREWLISDYAPFFIGGAVSYCIWKEGITLERLSQFVGAWLLAIFQSNRQAVKLSGLYSTAFDAAVVTGVVTCIFLVLLLVSVRGFGKFGQLRFATVGALTYPLYLTHQNIGYMVINRLSSSINSHVLFWGLIAAMLLCARLLNVAVEQPLARLLRRTFARYFERRTTAA